MFIFKDVKIWYRSFKISYKCPLQGVLYAVVAVQSPRNSLQTLLCKQSSQSSTTMPDGWNVSKSLQTVFASEPFATLKWEWNCALLPQYCDLNGDTRVPEKHIATLNTRFHSFLSVRRLITLCFRVLCWRIRFWLQRNCQ